MVRVILLSCIMLLLFGCTTEKHYNEWVNNNGNYNYYNNSGEKLRNTNINLDGKIYYFDKNGNMLSGWHNFGNSKRHFDANGTMDIGWKEIDNNWYLFNEDGLMCKEWGTDGNNWYYFGTDGIMQKSRWVKNDYFVDDNGIMLKNGWYTIDGENCYFDNDGKIDRSKDYQIELQNIKKQQEQDRQNSRKRSLTYEDFYGSHTITFILPELPYKSSMGLTINDITLKYSVNQDWGGGVNIWAICSGTKDTYTYPQVRLYGKSDKIWVGSLVAEPPSDYNYWKTTFKVSSDIVTINTMEKEGTVELIDT